ncbi:MAG: hypothetical protein AB7P04_11480 [Bacteriovoracia bacterium]
MKNKTGWIALRLGLMLGLIGVTGCVETIGNLIMVCKGYDGTFHFPQYRSSSNDGGSCENPMTIAEACAAYPGDCQTLCSQNQAECDALYTACKSSNPPPNCPNNWDEIRKERYPTNPYVGGGGGLRNNQEEVHTTAPIAYE